MKRSPATDKTFDVRLPSAIASDLFGCGFRAPRRDRVAYAEEFPTSPSEINPLNSGENGNLRARLSKRYYSSMCVARKQYQRRKISASGRRSKLHLKCNEIVYFAQEQRSGKCMRIALAGCTSRRAYGVMTNRSVSIAESKALITLIYE